MGAFGGGPLRTFRAGEAESQIRDCEGPVFGAIDNFGEHQVVDINGFPSELAPDLRQGFNERRKPYFQKSCKQ